MGFRQPVSEPSDPESRISETLVFRIRITILSNEAVVSIVTNAPYGLCVIVWDGKTTSDSIIKHDRPSTEM